jgi:hypothetical protein
VKKNHLTIIFMKDTRRPLTFEVSIKLIIFLVVFVVASASTYAFFIRGYYSLYRDNGKLEQIIRSLKTEIGRLQNTINRIRTQDSTGNIQGQISELAEMDENTVTGNEKVSIENLNLETNRSDGKFEYYFILHNNTENEQVIRGYLFLSLLNSVTKQKLTSYPEVEFRNGEPVNFRLGDRYAIKRFKEYRGQFNLQDQADSFEILVYSDLGDIMLRYRKRIQK